MRLIQTNGVTLATDTFGDPADPAILLIMGGGASMDWWEEEFCERLAAAGRFVIRYDHRDTGGSTTYEPGAPGYVSNDLVADAVGVLDAYDLPAAHIVGMSMGGEIARNLTLDHPGRVASLTLLSTSPGQGADDLPPMAPHIQAAFSEGMPEPDWSDRASVIDYFVADARLYAAPSRTFEEEAMRDLISRVYDRSSNMASAMNHFMLGGEGHPREDLAKVSAPTLVLHGTEDPLFPYEHGRAMAKAIPGARLVAMERTGHEIPRAAWDVAVPEILRHTGGRS
ncbi:alpha/beta hydrolase [Actinomadura barringtoniae]|uniref:Alpha/beta hydrolase n=1 Tax=Actinomadura barringtoniae TaxID=1427535 RepID=A0A939PKA9_9ACTN|nr:alpha/beta hydrolase [Actinomadura barringtoniae]MBO2450739.1 alpha/beta hydrolase [Actinomadura barringtoniae]